jgi:1-acyl-sn-glycerol-3-phosphate acyltransferase
MATLLGLLIFAIGSLLMLLVGFLPGLLQSGRQSRKQFANRQRLARLFGHLLAYFRFSGLIQSPSIQGLQYLNGGAQLIVATHPSLIDSVLLLALIPNANCVTKSALWRNPITALPLRALGYIRNDSSDLVAECTASLQSGNPLIIFAEGTRSVPGQPLRLLRGSAHIAISANVGITPVIIHCEPRVFGKGQTWFAAPQTAPLFSLDIYPEIAVAPYLSSGQPRSKTARWLNRELEAFFSRHYTVPE